ncbi:hypothetical protein [Goodfellowiella coeruleoviolacea]|uniref:hypothetical protein n=1 Tax=Goodfellowiella coeruleoviolacea TaxID=334858 RepID=UPI0020A26FF7|nr:hypothetical protein [Goodfellowiella coeruleoviolacea]
MVTAATAPIRARVAERNDTNGLPENGEADVAPAFIRVAGDLVNQDPTHRTAAARLMRPDEIAGHGQQLNDEALPLLGQLAQETRRPELYPQPAHCWNTCRTSWN